MIPSLSPRIPLERLAQFCGNLHVCLSSGLDVPTSLRLCLRSAADPRLHKAIEHAARSTVAGQCLSEALEPWQSRFPPFFLPVLRCGEQSGRQDQALAYLEQHCRLLAAPVRTMRNTWLAPLVIMLFGSAICAIAYLWLAPLRVALAYLIQTAAFYGGAAALLAVGVWIPQARKIIDGLKLALPIIGPAERELAMSRFFHAMNLLYSTGGMRVEQMIRLAAHSADNFVIRLDLLRAARVVERGGTISAACSAPLAIPYDYKAIILAGDEAGKLEAAFQTVSRSIDESVQQRLSGFQQLFYRAVALAVVCSMTTTIHALLQIRG